MSKQIKSEVKIQNLLLLMGVVFGGLICGFIMIGRSFDDEYVVLVKFLIGVGLVVGGIAALMMLLLSKSYMVEDKKLSVISFYGKIKEEIPLSEIKNYAKIERESKHSNWEDLIIFTRESSYTISSSTYTNYEKLKKKLVKGKSENQYAVKQWHYQNRLKSGLGFFTFGFLYFCFAFNAMVLKKGEMIQSSQLSAVEGTIMDEIEIIKSGKRRTIYSIDIELQEYPKFVFSLGNIQYRSTDVGELISNVHKGDKVSIYILKDQYHKKITNEIPMTFWDKTIAYRTIYIYGISDSSRNYFSLEDYNLEKEADRTSRVNYFIFTFGLLFMVYGFYKLSTNKKPKR